MLAFGVCQEPCQDQRPLSRNLTTTSYAVLAQLAVHPWSTYELARQRVRYFRYVWPRAESAIYREVKRLAAMGLVAAKREYVGKRPRTVYSITEAGRQVLREWLATPVSPFAMDFEAMIRLFIAPLGTKEQLVATLEQVRDDAQEMLALRRRRETGVPGRPGRAARPGLHPRPRPSTSSSASSPPSTAGPSGRWPRSRDGRISPPTGRTTEASRSWPSSRRRLPASTPIAHRCRPAPSGGGAPQDQAAGTEPDAAHVPSGWRALGD